MTTATTTQPQTKGGRQHNGSGNRAAPPPPRAAYSPSGSRDHLRNPKSRLHQKPNHHTLRLNLQDLAESTPPSGLLASRDDSRRTTSYRDTDKAERVSANHDEAKEKQRKGEEMDRLRLRYRLSIIRHSSPSFLRRTSIYHGGCGVRLGIGTRRSFHLLTVVSARRDNPDVSRKPQLSKNMLRAKHIADHNPTLLASQAIGTVATAQANFMRVVVQDDGGTV
ncbi:hypothetical protein Bca52824_015196 [Brassica carinata]|uniref:Uncharacterized protein n=1 Tax=Brassica carinata TaxID=52824 RepID=A0A8X8B550_BRACI|nr:hypothetical protein Bca52824_015196 [Brassica carinata]